GSRMTKAQMIARLKVMAKILGRDVDTSGTQAELEQRLMEWEEEAASLPSTEANSSELKGATSQKNKPVPTKGDGVWVRMLASCHLVALNESGFPQSQLTVTGQRVFIEAYRVNELVNAGLAVVSKYDDA
ncbi:TPA: DNA-packaging protein FI, partial [Providencia alcalifaciens]